MIDLESMVKSLRLALLKRLFNDSNVTWKTYLLHLLDPVKQFSAMGGPLSFCTFSFKRNWPR